MSNKIRVKTKTQREIIESNAIVSKVSEDGCCVELSCKTVSFDELAAMIDYVRPKTSLDLSIVAPEMREVVETWLAYKKEKGQMYKPTAFKTFYRKFCELCGNNPQVAMAIVEQSIQNNYAGIFPLRNNNNNNNYGRETITDKIRRTFVNATAFKQRIDEQTGMSSEVCNGDTDEPW